MKRTPRPATLKGPDTTFTGHVLVEHFADGSEPSRLAGATVRFTPGARTHWHSHGLGQTLLCCDGEGFVVDRAGEVHVLRPGVTVDIAPGEEHWHGATRERQMAHVAMLVAPAEGDATTWLEPVADEDYAAAHAALAATTDAASSTDGQVRR